MTPADMAATHRAAFTQSRPWTQTEFAQLLNNRFVRVFGDTTCFAVVQIIGDEAELLTIATHPTHQRKGLARACMENWHAKAATLGAKRAFLEVAEDNPAAIALYHDCGYFGCGRRRGYYRREGREAVDAIVMERQLS